MPKRASERKYFDDCILPIPRNGTTAFGLKVEAIEQARRGDRMTLDFSLDLKGGKIEELEALVAKGGVLSTRELYARYSVEPVHVRRLVSWLRKEGFRIERVSRDGTSVFASATVSQIEKSLRVEMVWVTAQGGSRATAASTVPSLPRAVARRVHAIGGLQRMWQARRYCTLFDRAAVARASRRRSKGARSGSPKPPYSVRTILSGYQADIPGFDGAGQTIGIMIDTAPSMSDLREFWKRNAVPVVRGRVKVINVMKKPLPPRQIEETLDAEWASGIAPKAKIRIYATGSLYFQNLGAGLDRILSDLEAHPGMRQLSISVGQGELYSAPGEVRTQHRRFLRLAAAGVNVFVASGDGGSNPSRGGHTRTGALQVETAASDPCVVAVGGTRLKFGRDGKVHSEVAWRYGGGGRSIFFPRPAWQRGRGVPKGSARLVPDLALSADPRFGAEIIYKGKRTEVGGTSWSAPICAGLCALWNGRRKALRVPPLPFLNPILYPLLGTSSFRQIEKGSNGAYRARKGYSMVTGLGSPLLGELHRVVGSGDLR